MDLVNKGKVTSSSSGSGHVHELNDISNVSVGNPNLNDALVYLDNKWVASPLEISNLADYNDGTATINVANLTATAATATLDSASTIGGISGTTIAADHAAWNDYNPAVTGTGWSTGATVPLARWIQIGKTVFFKGSWTFTTATVGSGNLTLSLPVTSLDSNWIGTGRGNLTGVSSVTVLAIAPVSTTTFQPQLILASGTYLARIGLNSTTYTKTAADVIIFSGTYEAA